MKLHIPILLERFIVAVDKAAERLQVAPAPSVKNAPLKENFFFLRTEGKIYKIIHDELLYAEAKGNNTKVVTVHPTLLPAITFSGFEELLPRLTFLPVHRSFIVNKSKITHI